MDQFDDIKNELRHQMLALHNQRLKYDELLSVFKRDRFELWGIIKSGKDEFTKQLEELGPFRLQMLSIRANELEKLSPYFDREARSQRNELVHGGNVKMDLEALRYLIDCSDFDRLTNARIGFHSLYGRPANELQSNIANAPQEILGILDKPATLETIHKWKLLPRKKGWTG